MSCIFLIYSVSVYMEYDCANDQKTYLRILIFIYFRPHGKAQYKTSYCDTCSVVCMFVDYDSVKTSGGSRRPC